ncbi:MAG TPA: hypothetical protein VGM51_09210 [Armatimonadota bacterium]|jgi:hypothetical protein
MNTDLTPDDLRECESAMSYIEDMTAWFDEEAEEGTKLDFALRILDQIDRRGSLSRSQKAWCETRVRERYAQPAAEHSPARQATD